MRTRMLQWQNGQLVTVWPEEFSMLRAKWIPLPAWDQRQAVRRRRGRLVCEGLLREAGMIRSRAQKIIAEGTDRCFLNELKKERKG